MIDRDTYKLGDILNFRRGYDLPKTQMIDGEVPVAGSNGIIGYHNIATPIEPCITIGRSGNVGTPYIYDRCWAHNTVLYIDDFKGNDPLYLYYLLKTVSLSSYSGGSAVPTLNRNHIHPIEVKFISSLKEQKRISYLLSVFDNKIEVNKRINDNLEQQAQALYKSWFIDFEPFKDQGVVDSEIGLIPEGWHCTTLSEFLSIKYGKDHKKLSEGIIPVYGSGGLMRYVDTKLHEGEAVLIPRKGSLNNVLYVNEAFWTVDTMFYSIPKQEDSCIYTYLFLANKDLASMNAGSAVPSMTTDILNNMPITEPPAEVLKQFNNICDVYFSRINQNNIENANLSNQRDTLLPKLMSGELTINEIDC